MSVAVRGGTFAVDLNIAKLKSAEAELALKGAALRYPRRRGQRCQDAELLQVEEEAYLPERPMEGADGAIAGSGIVGCLIAKQLLYAGHSVLMLESR